MTNRQTAQKFLAEYIRICRRWRCSIDAEIDQETGVFHYNEILVWGCQPGHVNSCLEETRNELLAHLPTLEDEEDDTEAGCFKGEEDDD